VQTIFYQAIGLIINCNYFKIIEKKINWELININFKIMIQIMISRREKKQLQKNVKIIKIIINLKVFFLNNI
jgi:hypothetical protein